MAPRSGSTVFDVSSTAAGPGPTSCWQHTNASIDSQPSPPDRPRTARGPAGPRPRHAHNQAHPRHDARMAFAKPTPLPGMRPQPPPTRPLFPIRSHCRVERWRGGMFCDRQVRGLTHAAFLLPLAAPWVTMLRFQRPPPRTVRAVLPHTAHRRHSPPAFGFSLQGRCGLGATTIPSRLIRPS